MNAPARGSSSAETASMYARSGESPLRDGRRVDWPATLRRSAKPQFSYLRAHRILQAGRSRPRYETGATGIGKLENGSRPEAISEVARLRRSLPEPDPVNRAAISIRSARPPIITVIGGLAAPDRQHHWLSVAAEVIVRPLAVPARPERPGTAAQMVSPATGRRSQRKPGRRT